MTLEHLKVITMYWSSNLLKKKYRFISSSRYCYSINSVMLSMNALVTIKEPIMKSCNTAYKNSENNYVWYTKHYVYTLDK